ncbi:MAG: hypothetical protein ACJAYU_000807 [Bradymonadia bacterium]
MGFLSLWRLRITIYFLALLSRRTGNFMRPTALTFATILTLLASPHADALERRPGPDEESPGAVSVLESFVETARLGTPGWLQGEFAYRAAFAAYDNFGQELTLHTGELLIDYTISRKFEVGLGWHMFGVLPDEFSKISGVGDPYLRGKLSLPLQSTNNPQALGVLVETRFGLGQHPVTYDGFTATILGIYTVQMGDLEIDANAGIVINSAGAPSTLAVPLGGRGAYGLSPWLRVFVEFTETLVLDSLRSSQTQLGAGVAAQPVPRVSVHLGGGIGLSENVPAGYFQVGVAFQAAQAADLQMNYGP